MVSREKRSKLKRLKFLDKFITEYLGQKWRYINQLINQYQSINQFYLICLIVTLVSIFEITFATLTMISKPYVVTVGRYKKYLSFYNHYSKPILTEILQCINMHSFNKKIPRADLDMKTATRWRFICLYKDISVIISHSIVVI